MRQREVGRYYLHMLVSEPWVGVAYTGVFLKPAVEHLIAAAGGAVAHLLVRPAWHGPETLPAYLALVRETRAAAPNIQFTIAAATAEDDLMFRRAGLSSIWCNHNAFVDERLFAPTPGAAKLYDAVHVGRLSPFKRHELAARVPRLALASTDHFDPAYADAVIGRFEDLRFANYDRATGIRELAPDEIVQLINAARCGLALSALEGAMYSSIECLLCGLPIVTTPSQGGRDVFFHPDYVETVDPDPAAVAAGVARIIARGLDPAMIRRRTIELMQPHRARLLMWLSGIVQQNLFLLAKENLWLPSFTHKLETLVTPRAA